MFTESDLTFIIPFRGNGVRVSILNRNLIHLTSMFPNSNFFVAEHNYESTVDIKLFKNVRYDLLKCDKGDPFNRTGTLNHLIRNSHTNIIINHDSDVFIEKDAYILGMNLISSGSDMIIPYNGEGWNIHHDYILGDPINVPPNYKRWVNSIGGVVMVNRDSYINAGMENENIVSWGYEDFERLYRFRNLGYVIRGSSFDLIFKKYILYHYDHDCDRNEDSSNNPRKNENKKISEMIKKMNREDLINHISKWKWVNKNIK